MRTIFLVLFSFLTFSLFAGNESVDKTRQAKEWLNNQPLAFTENKGQFTNSEGKTADNVLFKASYGNCDIYITTEGLSYVFHKYEQNPTKSIDTNTFRRMTGEKTMENKSVSYYRLDMNLQGSTINKTEIIKELPGNQGVTNYFYPHCPDGIYGVQEYGKITIKNIYKGIDWVIYTNADNKEAPLKYDFVVQPQANYKDIKIKFVNAQSTSLADNGTKLKIQTIAGNIEEGNLYSYLENSKVKQAIKTNYIANSDSTFEFELGTYDKTKTLVIDPLVWATYYGGSSALDFMKSICTDSKNNIYIIGNAGSPDFPIQQVSNSYWQSTINGYSNLFILKFNDYGIRQWGTFYGGSSGDRCGSIHADNKDNIYVTGNTNSADFPIQQSPGYYDQFNLAGMDDVFILKFNNYGVRLWATYYGGSYLDYGISITTDSQGNIYFAGNTNSSDFPIQQSPGSFYQSKLKGYQNLFIVKLNNTGARQWATYYGGNDEDNIKALTVDNLDNIYITGGTFSKDFPIQPLAGAYNQANNIGNQDVIIIKINKLGIREWATYYGGSGNECGFSICSDRQNNIYITGETYSNNFPSKQLIGAFNQLSNAGSSDLFILKFIPQGAMQWSTYFGGNDQDIGYSICSDRQNNLFITGTTQSTNFPTQQVSDEYWQPSKDYSSDAFLLLFNNQGLKKWSTYYGGSGGDNGAACAVDNMNSFYSIGNIGINSYTIDYGIDAYFDDSYINADQGFILKVVPCSAQKPMFVETDRNNICSNDEGSISLSAYGGNGDVLKWYSDIIGLNNIGKDSPQIIQTPEQTTTYYVRWESSCGNSECDSIEIIIIPEISVTRDPYICPGETYTVGTSSYMITGIYKNTLRSISGCDSIITTNLTVYPVEQNIQSPNKCTGESITVGLNTYTETGTYTDVLTSSHNCDSTVITNLTVNPTVQIPATPSICEGETFTVGTNNYSTPGIYIDVLKTSLGCDSIVKTTLTVNPVPDVSLGNDQLICPGDSITLTPGNGLISYLWSDGSLLSNLIVTSPGKYSVTAFNEWCPASDEITINECGSELWFPNAFTPNGDYNNDSFNPVILGTLITYQILIYNRWGQQVYESNNVKIGWDGSFKGNPCPIGQYVYIATYSMGNEPSTQKHGTQRGTVTLLR